MRRQVQTWLAQMTTPRDRDQGNGGQREAYLRRRIRETPLRADEDDERRRQLSGEATGRREACHLRAHGSGDVIAIGGQA